MALIHNTAEPSLSSLANELVAVVALFSSVVPSESMPGGRPRPERAGVPRKHLVETLRDRRRPEGAYAGSLVSTTLAFGPLCLLGCLLVPAAMHRTTDQRRLVRASTQRLGAWIDRSWPLSSGPPPNWLHVPHQS